MYDPKQYNLSDCTSLGRLLCSPPECSPWAHSLRRRTSGSLGQPLTSIPLFFTPRCEVNTISSVLGYQLSAMCAIIKIQCQPLFIEREGVSGFGSSSFDWPLSRPPDWPDNKVSLAAVYSPYSPFVIKPAYRNGLYSSRWIVFVLKWWITDDIQSMEVSGYLCTLTSAGLVGIETSRNIYVPTIRSSTLYWLLIPLACHLHIAGKCNKISLIIQSSAAMYVSASILAALQSLATTLQAKKVSNVGFSISNWV